ncbi:hypothetical protein [Bacillus cereus]|uniref:hypothetical protein n=1 Tax=Bacillus cereus TaxID=1396 RepID=UPI0013D0FAA5|nr:hypothetical protein [Bacillus cereus]
MYPHWNQNINQQYVYSPHPARNTLHHDSQYMMQHIASLESQLTKLISLIEENNQFIKSMEQQQQHQVCAPAGGSVIVHM